MSSLLQSTKAKLEELHTGMKELKRKVFNGASADQQLNITESLNIDPSNCNDIQNHRLIEEIDSNGLLQCNEEAKELRNDFEEIKNCLESEDGEERESDRYEMEDKEWASEVMWGKIK